MKSKRMIAMVVVCILGVLLIYMLPTDVVHITNATVNDETGDIAFCYTDSSGGIEMLRIVVFNKAGEKLFSRSFVANGAHADMLFYEGKLSAIVGRDNDYYCIEMDGSDSVDFTLPAEDVMNSGSFSGWHYCLGKHTYLCGDYLYCYNEPSVFSHYSSITITYGNETKIIFESPVSE